VLIASALRVLLNPGELPEDQPKAITAAELWQLDGAASLPTHQVVFTVQRAKPTGLQRVRSRRQGGPEKTAYIFLLQVQDKWLVAAVPSGFSGSRLVGRLERLDSPGSQRLVEEIVEDTPDSPVLMSYELNTVDSVDKERPVRVAAVGLLAGLGLLGCFQGLRMVVGASGRAAPAMA
jgi:hypothetical protein